jgi:hypothetical protein
MSECISNETPEELRARAERYRKLAWDFRPDIRAAMLEVVARVEAMAAKLEADRGSPPATVDRLLP